MKNSNLPYMARIGIASCTGNDAAVEQAVQECLFSVSRRVVDDVVCKYSRMDLAIVLAGIKSTVSGLESLLDKDDLEIEELICEQTKCITVDGAELLRQAHEEKN